MTKKSSKEKPDKCNHPPEYVLLEAGYPVKCLKCNQPIHIRRLPDNK